MTSDNAAAGRGGNYERLSHEEWQALAGELNANGRRLDTMLPLHHQGGYCNVPELRCTACNRPLDQARFTAATSQVPGKPWLLRLDAVARCPDCEMLTLYRQDYWPPRKSPKATMSDGAFAQGPVHISPVHVDPFNLVGRARLISNHRGESASDRAKPIARRALSRALSPGCLGTLTAATAAACVLHLPSDWMALSRWDWALAFDIYRASSPMAIELWATYELAVLWASRVHWPEGAS